MRIIERYANKISKYNRERKWRLFIELFGHDYQLNILDVGFAENEYTESDNYIERNYPYPEKITALGIDQAIEFHQRYPKVTTVTYDGGKFPFGDKHFDICWSNAVLEHVGTKRQQLYFLQEIKRVAKSAFITTPNRYFPIEIHTRMPFIHLLPKRVFDRLLILIEKGWATGNYMNLLSYKDINKMLHEAGISEYKIIKNKILFIAIDFIIFF